MIYRGQEIPDKIWVTKFEEEPVKEFDSNDFDLDYDDLKWLQKELESKKYELKEKGVEFKNLRLNFYATEYRENDYGPDDESQCTVIFAYDRPETEEESKERIENKKKWIDKQIVDEERTAAYKKASEEKALQKAMDLLKSNGYKVSL